MKVRSPQRPLRGAQLPRRSLLADAGGQLQAEVLQHPSPTLAFSLASRRSRRSAGYLCNRLPQGFQVTSSSTSLSLTPKRIFCFTGLDKARGESSATTTSTYSPLETSSPFWLNQGGGVSLAAKLASPTTDPWRWRVIKF